MEVKTNTRSEQGVFSDFVGGISFGRFGGGTQNWVQKLGAPQTQNKITSCGDQK